LCSNIGSAESSYRNKIVELLNKKEQTTDKHTIDDNDCKRLFNQIQDETQLVRIRKSVLEQYIKLVRSTSIKGCAKTWANEITINETVLSHACYDIEIDLRILLARRKNLIGKDTQTDTSRPTRGKIAGITTYRLSKAHIIHLSPSCIRCNLDKIKKKESPCPITILNTEIAIHCGLYFIRKSHSQVPDEVLNEIIFTLNKRHTNQETLGIVFDTIKTLIP